MRLQSSNGSAIDVYTPLSRLSAVVLGGKDPVREEEPATSRVSARLFLAREYGRCCCHVAVKTPLSTRGRREEVGKGWGGKPQARLTSRMKLSARSGLQDQLDK